MWERELHHTSSSRQNQALTRREKPRENYESLKCDWMTDLLICTTTSLGRVSLHGSLPTEMSDEQQTELSPLVGLPGKLSCSLALDSREFARLNQRNFASKKLVAPKVLLLRGILGKLVVTTEEFYESSSLEGETV